MIETILILAALLLSLFCLGYSVIQRRDLYFPLPKGLPGFLKNRHAIYLAMLGALAISAAASSLERLAPGVGAGPCAVSVAFQVALLLAFAIYAVDLLKRKSGATARRGGRLAVLLLALTAAAGVAIRMIWAVRVELFFEAFALFGCMVLLEQDDDSPARGRDKRFQYSMTLAVALTILAVIAMNVAVILNLSSAQSDEIGNTQLDVIRSDLQDTITEAETNVLRVAIGAEQLMESGASREALTEYFYEQRDKHLSDESFLNVYIAGRDWYIVPDFNAPEGFHAAERVWYIGAQDCPGEVYISEPYMDANGHGCASPSPRCCPTARPSSAWI